MSVFQLLLLILLYLLSGQVFSLCYLINYKPAERTAWLGLMGLAWPLFLIIDVLLQIAGSFGTFSKTVLPKINK